MTRLRHRPDHFMFKGDRMAFHRHQDGSTLGRLDPYSEQPQRWPLHSGRTIDVTGADVRDITLQVHGIKLPETRPTGECVCDEDRLRAIEDKLALLFQMVGASEVEETDEETPAPAPEPEEQCQIDPPPPAPPAPPSVDLTVRNEMLSQRVADLQAALEEEREENKRLRAAMPPPEFAEELPDMDQPMVPPDLREEMSDGETISEAKRRLFPLLTEERQKLKNEEALIGKTIPRRERVEKLLGMLARVGETK